MVLHWYEGGLKSPYRDPRASRKGRAWARILMVVGALLSLALAWNLYEADSGKPARTALLRLLMALGVTATMAVGVFWPPPGTGGFPENPRSRQAVTALSLFLIADGATCLALYESRTPYDDEATGISILAGGLLLLWAAWKPPRRKRKGPRTP